MKNLFYLAVLVLFTSAAFISNSSNNVNASDIVAISSTVAFDQEKPREECEEEEDENEHEEERQSPHSFAAQR